MIAKLALAAVMFASVPLMGATQADAAPGDGKRSERHWHKSDHGRKAKKSKSYKFVKHDSRSKSTKRKFNSHKSKRKFGYWGKGKRKWSRRSCHAAAKRRGGYGKRLWGIGGKAYGRHACDRAMYECRRELRYRKKSGRNPFARCVIVSRR